MLVALGCNAQHETLFSDWREVGAFGSPIMEVGAINGEVAAYFGGGGAVVLRDFFFGGYGLGNDFANHLIESGENAGTYRVKHRHGGLWMGYAHRPEKLAHLYSSLRLGWGAASMRNDDLRLNDRIFVLTPEVGVEINLYRFLKLGITAGYRWTSGISKLPGLSNSDFSSPVGALTLRIGLFGDQEWDNWDRDWE